MNNPKPKSCFIAVKEWWIDFYKAPFFWVKAISSSVILALAAFGLFKIISSAFHYFGEPLSYFDPERLGQLGDFLGGTINPIVGFLSIVLLFISISIQRKELKKTSEALENQLKQTQENSARNQLTEILNKEYERYDSLFSERFKHVNEKGKLAYRKLKGFETFKEIVSNDVGNDFSEELNSEFQIFNPLINPNEDYQKDIGAAYLIKIKIENSIRSLEKVTTEILNACDVESVETYWFMRFFDAMVECEGAGIISREQQESLVNNMQPLRKLLHRNEATVS